MRLSRYFHSLQDGYLAEIEDLRLDTEGRDVLQRRLADKRAAFDAVAPMMDTDPLMLAPALHGAFQVPAHRAKAVEALLAREPDHFPSWDELAQRIEIAAWAGPLVERALQEESGQAFLATVVGLEYLLASQRVESRRPAVRDAGADDVARGENDREDRGGLGEGDDRGEHGERDDRDDDGTRRAGIPHDDDGRDDDGADRDDGDSRSRAEDFLEDQGFDRRTEP